MKQHRGAKGYARDVDLDGEESKGEGAPRELDEWIDVAKKNTEFFSNERPDDLLASVDLFLTEKGYKFEVSQKKYKVKFQILYEDKPSVEGVIRVLKVDDAQNCIEMSKASGEKQQFLNEYKEFQNHFAGISDAKAN